MRRRRTIVAGTLLLAAGFMVAAAAGPSSEERPRPTPEPPQFQPGLDPALEVYRSSAQRLEGTLKGMASDILPGVARLWIEAFCRHYPGVTIELVPPFSGRLGAQALIKGEVDFALVSRELIPTDITEFEARHGYRPLSVPVSGGSYRHFGFLDTLAVIVSRDNPLERITLSQLDAIFSSTMYRGHPRISTWGELGLKGEWEDKPVTPYGITPWNGYEEFIRLRVLSLPGRRGEWRSDMQFFGESIFPATTVISKDRSGISYTGLSFLMGGVKTVAVSAGDEGPFLEPTFANAASWYYPLVRFIHINVNRAPGKPLDPILAEFIRFVLSRDGQQLVVDDALFLPLSAELASESRTMVD